MVARTCPGGGGRRRSCQWSRGVTVSVPAGASPTAFSNIVDFACSRASTVAFDQPCGDAGHPPTALATNPTGGIPNEPS